MRRRPLGAGWRIALAAGLLWLTGCSPVTTLVTTHAPDRSVFDARLRALGANPVIRQAALRRLGPALGDPSALAVAVGSAGATSESVRAALAGDVDEVVIVAWLVSFGAMGAWTAYNPDNPETVSIPVSDLPGLLAAPTDLGVYRLRDRRHLMLVRAVVVEDQVVGAVGFVLTQAYADPALGAEATPLE